MARIRYIKPEFFEDEDVALLGPWERLLYIGLWCFMDRNGVLEYRPRLIKRNVFPYDAEMTEERVMGLVVLLVGAGMLHIVNWEGREYLYCPTFKVHQKPHPGEKSKYPIPQQTFLASVQQVIDHLPINDQARSNHAGIGIGTGIGTGIGIGIGTGTGTLTGTGTGTGTDSELRLANEKLGEIRSRLGLNADGSERGEWNEVRA